MIMTMNEFIDKQNDFWGKKVIFTVLWSDGRLEKKERIVNDLYSRPSIDSSFIVLEVEVID